MLKDACATGFVIETKFSGSCDMAGRYSSDNGIKIRKQPFFLSMLCLILSFIIPRNILDKRKEKLQF
jgi:hypothetical protein